MDWGVVGRIMPCLCAEIRKGGGRLEGGEMGRTATIGRPEVCHGNRHGRGGVQEGGPLALASRLIVRVPEAHQRSHGPEVVDVPVEGAVAAGVSCGARSKSPRTEGAPDVYVRSGRYLQVSQGPYGNCTCGGGA